MKKSNFIFLLLGTVAGLLFALGMCATLLPQWNAFSAGVILCAVGMLSGIITFAVWCKKEDKHLPNVNGKKLAKAAYAVLSVLVLGFGMCLCLVWQQFVWGIAVGVLGIVMIMFLIPMFVKFK